MDRPLDEVAWQRAWADFRRVSHSPLFVGAVVMLDAALAAVAAIGVADPQTPAREIAAAIFAATAGGTIISFTALYLLQLALAPTRQRDEARDLARPPDHPPISVRFTIGRNDSEELILRIVRGGLGSEILRVGIKNHHPDDLQDVAANLATPREIGLEALRAGGSGGGSGELIAPPASTEHFWQDSGLKLIGGDWSSVLQFRLTAEAEGEWLVRFKLRVPGFQSQEYSAPLKTVYADP